MSTISQTLRQKAISFFNGEQIEQLEIDIKFIDYLNAYCYDLKKTEWDILHNDKMFNQVFDIFINMVVVDEQSIAAVDIQNK